MITALSKVQFSQESKEREKREAMQRALKWALTMQNKDGGWGSFDKGCNKEFLTKIPFADHNAMIDPSTGDITARGLETLAEVGFKKDHPGLVKAKSFCVIFKNMTEHGMDVGDVTTFTEPGWPFGGYAALGKT